MNETVTFDMLSDKSQANAEWEVAQRNKQRFNQPELTVDNSLFYRNGVFARRR